MSSREKILQAVSLNKPAFIEAPSMHLDRLPMEPQQAMEQFIKTLEGIGGKAVVVSDSDTIRDEIGKCRAEGYYVVNTIAALGEINAEINDTIQAQSMEPIFKAYVEGTLGVAENGSVWLYESQLGNRLLPFICQHLVICLDANKIVPTMHEAYAKIDVARDGYGVFLAGPSKTADIEQSLVIGAHGARSLVVYLVEGK